MDKNSNFYLFLKVIFILALLPFVLIWGVWKKTDWKKQNKWIVTAGIAVVFLFIIIPVSKERKENNATVTNQAQKIEDLEKQLEAEKQKSSENEKSKDVKEETTKEVDSKPEEENKEIIDQKKDVPVSGSFSVPVAPAPRPISTGVSYSCNCSKTCPQMSSCAEAQYQLNTCGCSRRDADHDGIACDADCQ